MSREKPIQQIFPTTAGAFETTHPSSATTFAPFVTKVKTDGSGLVYSTFLGGNNGDDGTGIAVDSSGFAYIAGMTESANFPTTSGAFQKTLLSTSDPFVAKLNVAGSALVYATLLGDDVGHSNGESVHIAVDSAGSAYVAGTTASTAFPTTPGAFQTVNHEAAGEATAFVTKLNTGGTGLDYSTYLGGSDNEQANSITVDSDTPPKAYITGYSQSTDFPTTVGAYQVTNNTTVGSGLGGNVFVTKLDPGAGATGLRHRPQPLRRRKPQPPRRLRLARNAHANCDGSHAHRNSDCHADSCRDGVGQSIFAEFWNEDGCRKNQQAQDGYVKNDGNKKAECPSRSRWRARRRRCSQ